MKTILNLFLSVAFSTLTTSASDNEPEPGPEWNISEIAYGQVRLVPDKIIPHRTAVHEWNGPWGQYTSFRIEVGYATGRQTHPGHFDFVEPHIAIKGMKDRSNESQSTTVCLFNRASVPEEIKVTFEAPPERISLDQEYKAATISGPDALCKWEVFVKFTRVKPTYIRPAEQPSK